MFTENSIIQKYTLFAFKTVEIKRRLTAVEEQFEKHYAYKLYLSISGLILNVFLIYYYLLRKGHYFSFKTEIKKYMPQDTF